MAVKYVNAMMHVIILENGREICKCNEARKLS